MQKLLLLLLINLSTVAAYCQISPVSESRKVEFFQWWVNHHIDTIPSDDVTVVYKSEFVEWGTSAIHELCRGFTRGYLKVSESEIPETFNMENRQYLYEYIDSLNSLAASIDDYIRRQEVEDSPRAIRNRLKRQRSVVTHSLTQPIFFDNFVVFQEFEKTQQTVGGSLSTRSVKIFIRQDVSAFRLITEVGESHFWSCPVTVTKRTWLRGLFGGKEKK